MKKIGILFGMDNTFAYDLIDFINGTNNKDVTAIAEKIGAYPLNEKNRYSVIFDHVSHEVPFYRPILKNALLNGTWVVNNPLISFPNDYFFYTSICHKIGIRIPKMAILPSKEQPQGSSSDSFHNLLYPLNWEEIFEYIGFPAILKPNSGTTGNNSYKVYNQNEFFSTYDFSGSALMVLRESFEYEEYYKCYIIGDKARIVNFDPRKPQHLRFDREAVTLDEDISKKVFKACFKFNNALGIFINSMEFIVVDGEPVFIEIFDPTPSCSRNFMAEEDYKWILESTAGFLIKLALGEKYKFKNNTIKSMFEAYDLNEIIKPSKAVKPKAVQITVV